MSICLYLSIMKINRKHLVLLFAISSLGMITSCSSSKFSSTGSYEYDGVYFASNDYETPVKPQNRADESVDYYSSSADSSGSNSNYDYYDPEFATRINPARGGIGSISPNYYRSPASGFNNYSRFNTSLMLGAGSAFYSPSWRSGLYYQSNMYGSRFYDPYGSYYGGYSPYSPYSYGNTFYNHYSPFYNPYGLYSGFGPNYFGSGSYFNPSGTAAPVESKPDFDRPRNNAVRSSRTGTSQRSEPQRKPNFDRNSSYSAGKRSSASGSSNRYNPGDNRGNLNKPNFNRDNFNKISRTRSSRTGGSDRYTPNRSGNNRYTPSRDRSNSRDYTPKRSNRRYTPNRSSSPSRNISPSPRSSSPSSSPSRSRSRSRQYSPRR